MRCSPVKATRYVIVLALLAYAIPLYAEAPPASMPTSVAASQPALQPLPDAAAQGHAKDLIHSLFKEDFAKKSAEDRQALARRLLQEALATHDDLAARFVLLIEAGDLAAGVGDGDTACRAVDILGAGFRIDVLEFKRKALVAVSISATTVSQQETLARLSLDLAESAIAADNGEALSALVNLAEAAANKTRRVALVAALQPRLADLRAVAGEIGQAQIALGRLEKSPDDAAAHLVVGRYCCLSKGDFDAGLAHLAKSDDAALRILAEREMLAPTDPLRQVELADLWWGYAEKLSGRGQASALIRARHWYAVAQANISGITLTRIQSRLTLPGNSTTAATAHTNSNGATTGPASGRSTAATAPADNLLSAIDPSKDSVAGRWRLANGALACDSTKYARILLPYDPPEEFDLRVAFTRTEGDGPVAILLHVRGESFGVSLDTKGEARLERVRNKIAKDNPTITPITLANGKRHVALVQIRKDVIRVVFDDKPLIEYKTDYKDLSRYTPWKLDDEKRCGLGAHNAAVTFEAVEVTPISGAGKALRAD